MAEQRGVGVRLYVAGGTEVRREFGQTADAGKRMWSEIASGQRQANPALRALSTGVSEAKGQMNALAGEAGAAGRVMGSLGVAGIAGAAAIGGLAIALREARDALAFADEIGDSATKVGIGAEALQEYRYAVHQTGGEFKDADAAIAGFTKALGGAESGLSPKLLKAFQSLGFSDQDLKAMKDDVPSALALVIQRISQLGSEAERAAVADKLGLTPMLPLAREGAERLAELRDEARKLGFVMSDEVIAKAGEANDKLEVLGQIVDVQLKTAFVELAPFIVAASQALADLLTAVANFVNDPRTKQALDAIGRITGAAMTGGVGGAGAQVGRELLGKGARSGPAALPSDFGVDVDDPDAIRHALRTGGTSLAKPPGKPKRSRSSGPQTDRRNAQGLVESFHTYVSGDDLADVIPAKIDLDVDLKPSLNSQWQPTLDQIEQNVHDAFLGGIEALRNGGLDGFLDWLKQSLMQSAAEGLATALTKLATQGDGGIGSWIAKAASALLGGGSGRHAAGGLVDFSAGEMGLELGSFGRTGQIFSHEDTVRAIRDAVQPQGAGVSVHMTYAPSFDARGAGPREIDALRADAARDRANLPGVIVQTINDAIERRQVVVR